MRSKAIGLGFIVGLIWTACLVSQEEGGVGQQLLENNQVFEVIDERAKLPLLTPALQGRQKLKIRLKNGLEALLISDKTLEQSGALLSVLAGSWYDPPEALGLAHFLEHMLFLGTRSYPQEGEFSRFISEHGGNNNAFTSGSHTSFLFSVDNNAFLPALSRFALFFQEPLLTPSGMNRELQAVDQEFLKGLEDDDRREFYVIKALFNPHHPLARMSAGNAASLGHITTDQMRAWYEKYYSADKMRLIVYSTLPLPKIVSAVVADFAGIAKKHSSSLSLQNSWPTSVIGSAYGGRVAYLRPIKQLRRITFTWEVPKAIMPLRAEKPEEIVATLLGDEGAHSLLARLKQQGLAESLACGTAVLDKDLALFTLQIDLTDQGLKERDSVIEQLFQTIAFLRSAAIDAALFDEIQKIDQLNYQYQKEENTFIMLLGEGSSIVQEELSTYPERSRLITKYDPKAVQQFLAALTPASVVITVMAPKELLKIKLDKKEAEMGIPYAVRKLSPALLQTLDHATVPEQWRLPPRNPFVPSDLELVKIAGAAASAPAVSPSSSPVPLAAQLHSDDALRLFWAPDSYFMLPKIAWQLALLSPSAGQTTPQQAAYTELWAIAVKDLLASYAYPAKLAGLECEIEATTFGVKLSVEGYSQKAPQLLQDIIAQMLVLPQKLTEERFSLYKEMLLRDFRSEPWSDPLSQGREFLRSVLYEYYPTADKKAAELEKITFEPFQRFAAKLFKQCYVQALLFGNMTREQALEVGHKVLELLQADPYPQGKDLHKKVILLPKDQGPFLLEKAIKVKGNALILSVEVPEITYEDQAVLMLLMQAIEAPFFDELRTKQQTGYIVVSEQRLLEGCGFANFAVQSATHGPQELLTRFEIFIEQCLRDLKSEFLPPERFNAVRQVLVQQLKIPPQTPKLMAEKLFQLAFAYGGDFGLISKQIEALQNLSYDVFVARAQQLLGMQNRRRLAVAVKGVQMASLRPHYHKLANIQRLRSLSRYGFFTPIVDKAGKVDKVDREDRVE